MIICLADVGLVLLIIVYIVMLIILAVGSARRAWALGRIYSVRFVAILCVRIVGFRKIPASTVSRAMARMKLSVFNVLIKNASYALINSISVNYVKMIMEDIMVGVSLVLIKNALNVLIIPRSAKSVKKIMENIMVVVSLVAQTV